MMPTLGKRMFSQNVILRGKHSEEDWRSFLLGCVDALKMTSAGAAEIWSYPTENGKGGLGLTICQPMTASFMVLDTWPDHDGAYLHVSSCRKFEVAALVRPAQAFGLGVDLVGAMEMLRL